MAEVLSSNLSGPTKRYSKMIQIFPEIFQEGKNKKALHLFKDIFLKSNSVVNEIYLPR